MEEFDRWNNLKKNIEKNADLQKFPNKHRVSVILAQMRLMSVKRFKRKLYDMEEKTMEDIRKVLKTFL